MSLKPQREYGKIRRLKKSFPFSFSLFHIYFIAVPFLCVLWVYLPSFSSLDATIAFLEKEKCCRKKKRGEVFIVGNKVRCLWVRLLFYAYVKLNYTTNASVSYNNSRRWVLINCAFCQSSSVKRPKLRCRFNLRHTKEAKSHMKFPLSLLCAALRVYNFYTTATVCARQ